MQLNFSSYKTLLAWYCTTLALAAWAVSFEVSANPIILPVGDSITQGFSSQLSYREEFEARLVASGCAPTMVGSQTTGHPTSHEGYSGHRADAFLVGKASNPGIATTMSIYSPPLDPNDPTNPVPANAVLMHIGTNDILQNQSVSDTLSEIDQIIDIIQLHNTNTNTNTSVYIANVVPWYDVDSDGDGIFDVPNSNTDALTDGINATYADNVVPGVHLVDVRTGFRPTDMAADGIHPNENATGALISDSGEHRIAVAFAAALEEQQTCVPSLPDTAFPLTDILSPATGDSVFNPIQITGKATDTGGDGFDRVRIAILDNTLDQWWDFTLETPTTGFDSIDAYIVPATTTDNYVDWRAGFLGDPDGPGQSGFDINLPPGDYTIYALAIDNAGNQNYFTGLWPERTQITVLGSSNLCNGLPVTVDFNLGQTTTPGSDVVLGTSGADDIRGKGGDDTICGMGGNDFIHGNSGDDWIDGGDGVDNIRGGQGSDTLFSGSGATVGTSSRVFGGTGDDTIFGGPDADDLRGGRGEDMISGEEGADSITGNDDDDILYGGSGADTLKGGNGGNDQLFGEGGVDSLNGGSGSNDFCDGGGQGSDTDTNCEVF